MPIELTDERASELRKAANLILELLGPEPDPEPVYTHKCRCCGHQFTYNPRFGNCECGAYMYPERCIELDN